MTEAGTACNFRHVNVENTMIVQQTHNKGSLRRNRKGVRPLARVLAQELSQ
jgi:hypothetical protein